MDLTKGNVIIQDGPETLAAKFFVTISPTLTDFKDFPLRHSTLGINLQQSDR